MESITENPVNSGVNSDDEVKLEITASLLSSDNDETSMEGMEGTNTINVENDFKQILEKIEDVCKGVLPKDQQFVFITTNTKKKTFDYFGTEHGVNFINKNDNLVSDFVVHCTTCVMAEKSKDERKVIFKEEDNSNNTSDHVTTVDNASLDMTGTQVNGNVSSPPHQISVSSLEITLENASKEPFKAESCSTGVLDEIDVEKSIENVVKILLKEKNMTCDDLLKELVKVNDSTLVASSPKNIRPKRNIKSKVSKIEDDSEEDDFNDEIVNHRFSDEGGNSSDNEDDDIMGDEKDEDYEESDEEEGTDEDESEDESLSNIKEKMTSSDKLEQYECSQCYKTYSSSKELKEHENQHKEFNSLIRNKKNECKMCNKTFSNKAILRRHCRAHFDGLKLKCSICGKCFNRSESLKAHMDAHNNKKISCDTCMRSYQSRSAFNKHLKKCTIYAQNDEEMSAEDSSGQLTINGNTIKLPPRKWTCQRCYLKFESEEFLNNHLKEHETFDKIPESKDNKCPECEMTFASRAGLIRHYRKHAGLSLYKCAICSKTFSRSDVYKNHLNSHGDQKFSCSQCGRQYNTRSALNKHLKKCGKSVFKCSGCSVSFYNKENFELHICNNDADPENLTKTYESAQTPEGKHVCGICKMVFDKRKGLLRHRKLHSAMYRSNVCNICNKKYSSRETLKKHISAVHAESKNFICDLCGKGFTRSDGLKNHLKVHNTDNSHKKPCSYCGKLLSSLAALNVHMRIHSDTVPYMCEVCGKSFRQQSNLRSHKLSHTDEANFQCERCPKKLKSLALWKIHMRYHALKEGLSDDAIKANYGKFYSCEMCGKKVATSNQMKQHMRSHSNERPYCCDICSKYFKERSKLQRHIKSVHSDRSGFVNHPPMAEPMYDPMPHQMPPMPMYYHN